MSGSCAASVPRSGASAAAGSGGRRKVAESRSTSPGSAGASCTDTSPPLACSWPSTRAPPWAKRRRPPSGVGRRSSPGGTVRCTFPQQRPGVAMQAQPPVELPVHGHVGIGQRDQRRQRQGLDLRGQIDHTSGAPAVGAQPRRTGLPAVAADRLLRPAQLQFQRPGQRPRLWRQAVHRAIAHAPAPAVVQQPAAAVQREPLTVARKAQVHGVIGRGAIGGKPQRQALLAQPHPGRVELQRQAVARAVEVQLRAQRVCGLIAIGQVGGLQLHAGLRPTGPADVYLRLAAGRARRAAARPAAGTFSVPTSGGPAPSTVPEARSRARPRRRSTSDNRSACGCQASAPWPPSGWPRRRPPRLAMCRSSAAASPPALMSASTRPGHCGHSRPGSKPLAPGRDGVAQFRRPVQLTLAFETAPQQLCGEAFQPCLPGVAARLRREFTGLALRRQRRLQRQCPVVESAAEPGAAAR